MKKPSEIREGFSNKYFKFYLLDFRLFCLRALKRFPSLNPFPSGLPNLVIAHLKPIVFAD